MAPAIDDEHAPLARLGQHRPDQRVVLVAEHSGGRPAEVRASTELAELQIT
jgi:hypothetical protein